MHAAADVGTFDLFVATTLCVATIPPEYLAVDNLCYIMSPRDILLTRPRDMDDRITWLLERERYGPPRPRGPVWRFANRPPSVAFAARGSNRFDEAMSTAETHSTELRQHNVLDVGQKYMKYLIEKGTDHGSRRGRARTMLMPLVRMSRAAFPWLAGEFELAAALCPKVLKTNQSLWEHYVYMFLEIRQHRVRFARITLVAMAAC